MVVQLPRPLLWVAGLAVLLPWAALGFVLLRPSAPPADAEDSGSAVYDDFVHRCRPGPWGELQYSRLLIEPPDDFVAANSGTSNRIEWKFVGYSAEALGRLWRTAGLSEAQVAALDAVTDRSQPAAISVRPTPEFILQLGAPARAAIYGVLSGFEENPPQYEPFRFRADAAEEWFSNSGLAPETIRLVTPLLYRRGTSLLFSDHDVVLPRIASRTERYRLIKTLARKSTLLLKLRVKPDSDTESLANYWGQGPRSKDLRPFLASVSQRPRGITVDVAHLLPRFARARLYTYPLASDKPDDGRHDCHWTSLNFFNDPPDEKFTDDLVVKHTLEQTYDRVVGRPTLGDIFVFTRPNGTVIHSCVYVADDIVFTKNGSSAVMPWILMNLSDVIAFYPADPPLTVTAFRRRDL